MMKTDKALKKLVFWSHLVMPPEMANSLRVVNCLVVITGIISLIINNRALLFGCICGLVTCVIMNVLHIWGSEKVIKYAEIAVKNELAKRIEEEQEKKKEEDKKDA